MANDNDNKLYNFIYTTKSYCKV